MRPLQRQAPGWQGRHCLPSRQCFLRHLKSEEWELTLDIFGDGDDDDEEEDEDDDDAGDDDDDDDEVYVQRHKEWRKIMPTRNAMQSIQAVELEDLWSSNLHFRNGRMAKDNGNQEGVEWT